MEAAFVLARFLQYAAASILFGSTLLILCARLELRVSRPLIAGAGLGLMIAGCAGLVAQTALLAGSLADALRLETLALVMQTMSFGPAAGMRIVIGLAAGLITLALPISRRVLMANLICGAIACISFAWSSHAAATEGSLRAVHLASDGIHALAAAGWVGSLLVFVGMVCVPQASRATTRELPQALARFSGLGIVLVGVLILTGAANTILVLGSDFTVIGRTAYGKLLIAKLALFGSMIVLAVCHRQLLVPALGQATLVSISNTNKPLRRLRISLSAEGFAGMAILAIVSVIGLLDPFS